MCFPNIRCLFWFRHRDVRAFLRGFCLTCLCQRFGFSFNCLKENFWSCLCLNLRRNGRTGERTLGFAGTCFLLFLRVRIGEILVWNWCCSWSDVKERPRCFWQLLLGKARGQSFVGDVSLEDAGGVLDGVSWEPSKDALGMFAVNGAFLVLAPLPE